MMVILTFLSLSLFFFFLPNCPTSLLSKNQASASLTAFCRSTLIVTYAAFDTLVTDMINPQYCLCLPVTGYPIYVPPSVSVHPSVFSSDTKASSVLSAEMHSLGQCGYKLTPTTSCNDNTVASGEC